MVNKKLNFDEVSTAMLIRWIDKMEFLEGKEKALLLKISFLLIKDRETLFKIYDEIDNEEKHYLTLNDEVLELSLENKKHIVRALIDFGEDILPLGSLVTLNYKELKDKDDNDLKIIITKRFLVNEKSGIYFTYSGTIYPTASLEEDKLLHFNGESIRDVIYKGYSDDVDLSYILAMKNELILNRDIHSIIFADEEQMEIFKKETSR